MEWNAEVSVSAGVAKADPRANPASVAVEDIVDLPERDRSGRLCSRLIVGLDAPTAETVTFEVWALDSRDTANPPAATDRWYIVYSGVGLAGGSVYQTRLDQVDEGFVSGGRFYVRRTADTLAATRTVLLRVAE